MTKNAKGPAEAATSPSRGSTNSGKEYEMNRSEHNITGSDLPSASVGGEAMTEDTLASLSVPVKTQLLRITDQLDIAKDLNEAIHMACGYLEDDRAKCAIQAVANATDQKLRQASEMLEYAREAL